MVLLKVCIPNHFITQYYLFQFGNLDMSQNASSWMCLLVWYGFFLIVSHWNQKNQKHIALLRLSPTWRQLSKLIVTVTFNQICISSLYQVYISPYCFTSFQHLLGLHCHVTLRLTWGYGRYTTCIIFLICQNTLPYVFWINIKQGHYRHHLLNNKRD